MSGPCIQVMPNPIEFGSTIAATGVKGVPVTITSWKFEQGCFRPKLKPGEICVFPLKPEVICNMNASSNDLQWDRTVKDYSPNPVTVTATFINNGDKDARNARYKLTYKKADFSLAGPMTDIQTVSPRDVKMSGGQVEVRWDLMAKKRTTGDTSEVCIIARSASTRSET